MAINLPAEEFDRDRDFVVMRPLLAQGTQFQPGDLFDNSAVTTRRLRQLWEQRFLRMLPPEERKQPLSSSGDSEILRASYLDGLSENQLRDWIRLRGRHPRRGMDRKRLLRMVEVILEQDTGTTIDGIAA